MALLWPLRSLLGEAAEAGRAEGLQARCAGSRQQAHSVWPAPPAACCEICSPYTRCQSFFHRKSTWAPDTSGVGPRDQWGGHSLLKQNLAERTESAGTVPRTVSRVTSGAHHAPGGRLIHCAVLRLGGWSRARAATGLLGDLVHAVLRQTSSHTPRAPGSRGQQGWQASSPCRTGSPSLPIYESLTNSWRGLMTHMPTMLGSAWGCWHRLLRWHKHSSQSRQFPGWLGAALPEASLGFDQVTTAENICHRVF